jgi:enoyl-CoA hydratase/carnithine racemase
MNTDIVIGAADGVLRITLNRPQKANALTVDMNQTLARELAAARADAAIRGVLIAGAGERVFSGGVDVRATSTLPAAEFRQLRSAAFFAVLQALVDFPKPVVAAVNGVASGGGFMIAALADVVIASENAAFALPEIDLGSPPLAGLTILSPLIGQALAYDLVQTGRKLNAGEALQCGLVREIKPQAELLSTAEQHTRSWISKNQRAIARSKAWAREPMRAELERAERAMVEYRSHGTENEL